MKREEPDLIQRKADPVNLGATLITTMHSCHSLGSLLGIKESHHTFIDQFHSYLLDAACLQRILLLPILHQICEIQRDLIKLIQVPEL